MGGMSRPWWMALLALLGLAALTVPFHATDLDLVVARWWLGLNQAHGGAWHDAWYWRAAYVLPGVLVAVVGGGSLVVLIRGMWRAEHRQGVRPAVFLLLLLLVGPGLLANAVLKDHWGRPRPRETVAFGGRMDYRAPWDKGVAGQGRSFPSGHVTVPAALSLGLWLLWRRRRPVAARWCLGGGLALTLFVGAQRMLANAHWLSDVLWAIALMAAVAAVLHRLIVRRGRPPE